MAETPRAASNTEPSGRLGLRLAFWYAVVFVVTSLAIILLTYRLLEASLVERDQQLVVSTLREYSQRYAEGGLNSLAEAVDIEQRSGRQERLFVRVVRGQSETFFLNAPDAFNDFDVSRLRGLSGLEQILSQSGTARLEVASALRHQGSPVAVVFLTVHDDEDFLHAAQEAGGTGYVVKRHLASDLMVAGQEARAGRSFVSALS